MGSLPSPIFQISRGVLGILKNKSKRPLREILFFCTLIHPFYFEFFSCTVQFHRTVRILGKQLIYTKRVEANDCNSNACGLDSALKYIKIFTFPILHLAHNLLFRLFLLLTLHCIYSLYLLYLLLGYYYLSNIF